MIKQQIKSINEKGNKVIVEYRILDGSDSIDKDTKELRFKASKSSKVKTIIFDEFPVTNRKMKSRLAKELKTEELKNGI